MACDDGRAFVPPPEHSGDRSALILIEEQTGPRVVALGVDEMGRFAGPPFDAENGARLTMLLYDLTTEELDIYPGAIELSEGSEPSRHLPLPAAVFEAEVRSGGFEWSLLPELPSRFDGFRINATPPADCLAAGGCFASRERAEDLWCTRPCPASVTIPELSSPADPVPVELTWSPPPRVTCSGADVQWVDAVECAPIEPCPAGRFGSALPSGSIYVDPTAAAGGDGSEAAPHRSIAEAFSSAAPGDVIALSKGSHTASTAIEGVSLIGTCAAETIVTGPLFAAGRVRIERTGLRAGAGAALTASFGADISLERAIVEGAGPGPLIVVDGADFTAREVLVRSPLGRAFEAGRGSSISLMKTVIEAGGGALVANGPLSILIDETVIAGSSGSGLSASGTLMMTRTLVKQHRRYGLELSSAQATIEDVVVRDCGADFGGGLSLSGTNGAISRVLIERTGQLGMQVVGGAVEITDMEVRELSPGQAQGSSAYGILIFSAGAALHRVRVSETRGRGIEISNTGEVVELSDLVIERIGDSDQGSPATQGFGLTVYGADVTGDRIRITDVHTTGIFMADGQAVLRDVSVTGSLEGNGIGAENMIRFELVRARLAGNLGGIEIAGDTRATLEHIEASGGDIGAIFGDGAIVEGSDIRILETQSHGICVRDQVDVTLERLEVARVRAGRSKPCTITNPPPGAGIVMNGQPRLTLSSFRLTGNETLGLLVNRDSILSLSDGEIRESFVGVQLDPEVNPFSVMVRVRFEANTTDFEVY